MIFFLRYRLFLCFLLTACSLTIGCRRSESNKNHKESSKEQNPVQSENETIPVDRSGQPLQVPQDVTPRQLLEKTVAAYKSAFSYSDHGTVQVVAKMLDPEAAPEPWPCTVAYQKPGKLRLEISEGVFVSDGQDCFAQIRPFPDQVLRFSTPETWTLETLFRDEYLDQAMEFGIPETILRFPPQLVLLFAKDPLKTLLPEGAEAEFRDPQWIGEIPCDLIRISSSEGNRLLWISRRNHALVRLDYFVEGAPVPEGIDSLRMIRIEMTDALLNWDIAPEAFQMQQPMDARQVSEFQPDEITLLGRELDGPETVTLKLLSKEKPGEVRSETVGDWKGKTIVLCFWGTGNEASRGALAELLKAREVFREDDRVRFIPVNLDDIATDNAALEQVRAGLDAWRLPLPAIRDVEGRLAQKLSIDALPSLVVLGPKEKVEFYYRGIVTEKGLSETIRSIFGGEKPYEKGLSQYERQREEHLASLRQMTEKDVYLVHRLATESREESEPVSFKEPTGFSLNRLWQVPLTGAGQVVVSTGPNGNSRLLVPCVGNLLAVLDPSGKVLKKEKPAGLLNDELLTLVRTGSAPNGQHYIGVSSVSGRAVHIYDDNLKPILSYLPDEKARTDSRSSPKTVVADFRFVDIYGSGTVVLLLGTMSLDGTTGDSLCAVDFQGKEIWRDSSVSSPLSVDFCTFDGQRRILVLCFDEQRGSLLEYDPQGKRLAEVDVGEGRQVLWFDVDNPEGGGQSEGCLISSDRDGGDIRVEAMDGNGKIRWSHPLPPAGYRKPYEVIVSGDLLGDETREWLVQGPDGSVFVFDSRGRQCDSFSFGKFLSGLAVLKDGDRRTLVTVDSDGVSAWSVTEK